MNQAPGSGAASSTIYRRAAGRWAEDVVPIQNIIQNEIEAEIAVLFLPASNDILSGQLASGLSSKFLIPQSFFNAVTRRATGFYGAEASSGEDGAPLGYNTFFRFLVKFPRTRTPGISKLITKTEIEYSWVRLSFFTSQLEEKSITLLCFGVPQQLQHSIMQSIQALDYAVCTSDAFALHSALVQEVATYFDQSVWAWRDLVRDTEKNRDLRDPPPPNYIRMHEIARHVIHSTETLTVALETIRNMVRDQTVWYAEVASKTYEQSRSHNRSKRALEFQSTLFECMRLRSEALEKRLVNEINLAFNTAAQADSNVMVKIGNATQADSAAMRTIAVLGLVFLPGTFTAGLFGMSFFGFSQSESADVPGWGVSNKFWVYWAVTVPLTVVTIITWFTWIRQFTKRHN